MLVIDISRKWRKPSLRAVIYLYKKIVTGSLINITVNSNFYSKHLFFLKSIYILRGKLICHALRASPCDATWSLREVSQPSKVSPVTYRAVFPINVLGGTFLLSRRYFISYASPRGQYITSLFTGEIVRRNPPEVKIFLTR